MPGAHVGPPRGQGMENAMTAVQMPTLKAQTRVAAGKAEARRLRRTG